MPLLTQLPDVLMPALIFGASLATFFLLGLLDGGDSDSGVTWGDDPHALAMLSGMSL